jgi:tetratricopeptide (TPR) repeat protein
MKWMNFLGWEQEKLHQMRRLGQVYIKQGRYRDAVDLFEALTLLDEESARDLQTLGALYLQVGEGEQALPALEQALMREPGHLPTLLHKGKALLMMGERDRGLTILRALEGVADQDVADLASALVMAYSEALSVS